MQTWPLVAKVAITSRSIGVRAEVGVVEQERRVVAAELHHGRGQALAGERGDRPAGALAAGEGDPVDAGVADQRGRRSRRRRARPATQRPSGSAAPSSSTTRAIANGASGDGLTTTALPAASAGPSLSMARMIGAFHGVTAATTPYGRRRSSSRPAASSTTSSASSPGARSADPAQHGHGEAELAAAVGAAPCRSRGPSARRARRARRRSGRRRRGPRRSASARSSAAQARCAVRARGARPRRRRPGRRRRRCRRARRCGPGSPARSGARSSRGGPDADHVDDLAGAQRVDHRGAEQVLAHPLAVGGQRAQLVVVGRGSPRGRPGAASPSCRG